MISVKKVRSATVRKCGECKEPLVPTPGGLWACPAGHGKLVPLDDNDRSSQRLGLILTGGIDPSYFGEAAEKIAADAAFIRSLPVAEKVKEKRRVVYQIGGDKFRKVRVYRDRSEAVDSGCILACATAVSHERVMVLKPVEK